MKGEIGVWEETTEKKIRWRGMSGGATRGEKKGAKWRIKEKTVGALRTHDQGRQKRHRRGDSLSFIQIFWEHGLSPAGSFV